MICGVKPATQRRMCLCVCPVISNPPASRSLRQPARTDYLQSRGRRGLRQHCRSSEPRFTQLVLQRRQIRVPRAQFAQVSLPVVLPSESFVERLRALEVLHSLLIEAALSLADGAFRHLLVERERLPRVVFFGGLRHLLPVVLPPSPVHARRPPPPASPPAPPFAPASSSASAN